MRIIDNKILKIIIIAMLSLMALVSVYKGCVNAYTYSQDFQWDAAKALSMGINPYDESLHPTKALKEGPLGDFYNRFERINAPQKMEANQFPSLLMLLFPMTVLTPDVARLTWLILNIIFTIAIIYFLRKTFLKEMDDFCFIIVSLLMVAGTPYRNQLGVGQHTLFAFAFFLMAVYFTDVLDIPFITVLGLFISYFKYTLTAPLVLYFIYKKRYKEVAISILMHGVLTVVAAFMLGDSIINMIKKPLEVASWLSSEGGIDLGVIFSGTGIAFILAGVIALLLLILTILAPKGCGNLIFATALLWSLVLTYHRSYDFFVIAAMATLLVPGSEMPQFDIKSSIVMKVLYVLVMLTAFFVLRVFSENTMSKVIMGILYYGFTIFVTYKLYGIVVDKIKAEGLRKG